MNRRWDFLMATGLGVGLSPRMPGTLASMASLILWVPLFLWQQPWMHRAFLVSILFAGGYYAIKSVLPALPQKDPPCIVIDEVVGQGLAFIFVEMTWKGVLLAVLFFRVFDIFKPWPIGALDRNIKGPLGIMLDDVVAGLFAGFILFFLHRG